MNPILSIAKISCQRATELIERRHVAPLSAADALRCRLHLFICDSCTRYEKQSALLESLLREHHHPAPSDPATVRSLQQRILKILR